MTDIARGLFLGPGAVVIEIALLAIGGWLMGYIAQAVGKGQLARLVHIAMLFAAFVIVVNTLWNALTAVARVLGIN